MQCIVKSLKNIHWLIFALLLLFLISAEANGIDPAIRRALAHMDRGEAYRAVEILEPLAKDYLDHAHLQTTLASAYVGLTHLQLRKFFPLIRKIKENDDFSEDLKKKRKALFPSLKEEASRNNSDLKEFVDVLEDISRATESLMYAHEYLRLVPHLNKEEYHSLQKAAEIYGNASFTLSRGDAAFALLVHFTVVRYRIKERIYFPKIENKENLNPNFYLHYGMNGLKYDIEQMFLYLEKVSGREESYLQDFRKDWERLEDFLHKNNLEINLLFEHMDFS